MPKINVTINQLKWNFAWVIIAIKAYLMQNLSPVAFLFLEIQRHKVSRWKREWVIKFGYLPPENGSNFKNNEFLCPKSIFWTLNWPPTWISAIFKQRKIFHFQSFWDVSMRKEQQQPPDLSILLKFGQNTSVLKCTWKEIFASFLLSLVKKHLRPRRMPFTFCKYLF